MPLRPSLRIHWGRKLWKSTSSFECPFEKRLRPLLPPSNSCIRREPVLKENELAAGLQDSSDTPNSLHHARNRAYSESANHRVYAGVHERNAFSGQIQKFDMQHG